MTAATARAAHELTPSRHGMAMGDVTGDGVGDILMGDYYAGNNAGAVYVAFGPFTEDRTTDEADAVLTGESSNDYAGRFMRAAKGGDLDGDGIGDFLVTAPYSSAGAPYGGILYVLTGPPSDMSLGDAHARILGDVPSDVVGEQRGMDLGDVDGDGLVDVAVHGSSSATVFIFEGDPTGDYAAGDADVILAGSSADGFGAGVTLGDVDLDGEADVWAGAPNVSAAGGGGYLFYSPPPGAYTMADADASFVAANGAGFSAALADLDTDGHLDVLLGATNTGGAVQAYGFSAGW